MEGSDEDEEEDIPMIAAENGRCCSFTYVKKVIRYFQSSLIIYYVKY